MSIVKLKRHFCIIVLIQTIFLFIGHSIGYCKVSGKKVSRKNLNKIFKSIKYDIINDPPGLNELPWEYLSEGQEISFYEIVINDNSSEIIIQIERSCCNLDLEHDVRVSDFNDKYIWLLIPNNLVYYHRCNMDNFKLFDCKAKVIYVKGKPIISRDKTLILKKYSGPDSKWLMIGIVP